MLFRSYGDVTGIRFPSGPVDKNCLGLSNNAFENYASLRRVEVPSAIRSLNDRYFCLYDGLGAVRLGTIIPPSTARSDFNSRFSDTHLVIPGKALTSCGATTK